MHAMCWTSFICELNIIHTLKKVKTFSVVMDFTIFYSTAPPAGKYETDLNSEADPGKYGVCVCDGGPGRCF